MPVSEAAQPATTRTTSPVPSPHAQHATVYGWALAALLGLQFAVLAPGLIYPDLNLDYPFMAGDSWDWIANGLAYSGADVRFSGRPPLLPLLIALCERLGALPLWPLVNLAVAQAAVLLWYALALFFAPPRAAFAAACCLAVAHARLESALPVMADSLAAALLLAAAAAFVAAERRPAWYLAAGFAGGLSAVTQQAALLLPLPAAIAVLLGRRHHWRTPWLWAGMASFAVLPAAWWTWQRLGPLGPGFGLHSQLLRPHVAGLGFYLFSALAWSGVPAACGMAIGLVWWLRRGSAVGADGGNRLFIAMLAATMAAFFAAFYDYRDHRFWLYVLFPASLFLAEALAQVRRPAALWALTGLVAATAALPLPGGSQGWAAAWPLPPLYARLPLRAAANGSAELDGAPALVRRPWPAIREDALPARVWSARRHQRPTPRLAPALLANIGGAVFLFDHSNRGDRYLELTRLGNALRAPVKFLPQWWLAPREPRVSLRFLGRHDRYQIYRAQVAGLRADWLFAAAPDGASQRLLAALASSEDGTGEAIGSAPPGLREALAVREFLDEPRARQVAMLDREGTIWEARLYLPLVLDTTEIAVLSAAAGDGLLAFLGHPALEQARTIGATSVERRRLRGLPGAILQPVAGGLGYEASGEQE